MVWSDPKWRMRVEKENSVVSFELYIRRGDMVYYVVVSGI